MISHLFILFFVILGDAYNKTMYFMIFSHYKHIDRRKACRNTWLTALKNHTTLLDHMFFLTTPSEVEAMNVEFERKEFKDIIVSNCTKNLNNNPPMFYLWMWEVVTWIKHRILTFDYYLLVHDDSFICVDHLLHDSMYWPTDAYLAHMRKCASDVVMIMGQKLMSTGYEVFHSGKLRSAQLWDTVLKYSPSTIRINEIRLFYGARGPANGVRYNDWKNGWVGGDRCTVIEKENLCEMALSTHQAYPHVMYDLWANVSSAKTNYTQPILSNNCKNLDNVPLTYNN